MSKDKEKDGADSNQQQTASSQGHGRRTRGGARFGPTNETSSDGSSSYDHNQINNEGYNQGRPKRIFQSNHCKKYGHIKRYCTLKMQ